MKKTLVGVLSSHDDPQANQDLAGVFEWAYQQGKLDPFHFLFTGGTFERVVLGKGANAASIQDTKARDFVRKNSTKLPAYSEGGVTILANSVVQRQCSVVWALLSPQSTHWLNPENLALLRLCDTVRARRFLNVGSVKAWLAHQVGPGFRLHPQTVPPSISVAGAVRAQPQQDADYHRIPAPPLALAREFWHELNFAAHRDLVRNPFGDRTIALIAHDEMKTAMIDFALAYEHELGQFSRILTTTSTGRAIEQAARSLASKICPCRSGPLGGDIEIATEVLYGQCDVVIFFQDPQSPHPHVEDIRTLIAACMRAKGVLAFTNEEHARDWMNEVVRPNC